MNEWMKLNEYLKAGKLGPWKTKVKMYLICTRRFIKKRKSDFKVLTCRLDCGFSGVQYIA